MKLTCNQLMLLLIIYDGNDQPETESDLIVLEDACLIKWDTRLEEWYATDKGKDRVLQALGG